MAITADIVLASAAIPNLFRAVRLPDGTYWDGLFSQNPPVCELLDVEPDEHLGAAFKLNRDPLFIRDLIRHGEEQAAEFLAALAFERAWLSHDVAAVMDLFAEDAELISASPFPQRGIHRGAEQVHQFVHKQMARREFEGAWRTTARILDFTYC